MEHKEDESSKEPILVTAALPYANGSIHIGHLLEYISADVFVRALKLMGKDAIYICADDTHGTPIQVNAMKLGVSPRELVERFHKEHIRDLESFNIKFDNFYMTDSPENKELVNFVFSECSKKGLIYEKELEQLYCEYDKMFLPDRFVKGTCPVCGAKDQYGDVCEVCGAVYKPTDLIDPYCVLCGNKPVLKKTTHYFFKLSALSDKIKSWLLNNKNLQKEVVNSMLTWIDKGLEDWCISRDSPYFGFKIPGENDKYFYVWLDAPIGYIASTKNYCDKNNCDFNRYWRNPKAKIIHIIGKDITYFHLLFWPALLMSSGFSLPYEEIVHGFIKVNGEKMSKSRGTFITASDFLKSGINPDFLRFYFASNMSKKLLDINLDVDDFKDKINSELIGNLANFVYRVLSFTNKNFDSKVVDFSDDFVELKEKILNLVEDVKEAYEGFNLKLAVKKILEISDEGNKFFQSQAPWKLVKQGGEDFNKAHRVVSFSVNIVKILTALIKPVAPKYAESVEDQLGISDLTFSDAKFDIPTGHKINKSSIVLRKLDKEVESLFSLNVRTEKEKDAGEVKNMEDNKKDFSVVDLRVAEVKEVKDHPNADKLYVLKIDLGSEERQLVAGLKKYYTPEELLGKHLVVVCNLKHAKLRGVESQGMLLAADNGEDVKILEAPSSKPGSSVFAEGVEKHPAKEISIDDLLSFGLKVKDKKVVYDDKPLRTSDEIILVDMPDGSKIR